MNAPALIIHADDLGISSGVNRAIFQAHAKGIVTSASLLMGGTDVQMALRQLKEHPELDVGVHLCLHDETPSAPPAKIRSLVAETGKLLPLNTVIRQIATGVTSVAEIEAEYEAQISRAREAGAAITHLDSHCHLHAFPPVALAVSRVARRHQIKCVRKPQALKLSDYTGAPANRFLTSAAITACSIVSSLFCSRGFRAPDRFVGLVHSGSGDASWIIDSIAGLSPGTLSELMVHPGVGSDYEVGTDTSHGSQQRQAEYDLLVSDRLRHEIERRCVRLTSYREFVDRLQCSK